MTDHQGEMEEIECLMQADENIRQAELERTREDQSERLYTLRELTAALNLESRNKGNGRID